MTITAEETLLTDFSSAICVNNVVNFLDKFARSELGQLAFGDANYYVGKLLMYLQRMNGSVVEATFAIANAYHETNLFKEFTESEAQAKLFNYDGGPDYRGRGYVHLTGIGTYREVMKQMSDNWQRYGLEAIPLLVTIPNAAANPDFALSIMTAYFDMKGTYAALNQGNYLAARQTINPGESLNKRIGRPPGRGQRDTRPTIRSRILGLTAGLEGILRGC